MDKVGTRGHGQVTDVGRTVRVVFPLHVDFGWSLNLDVDVLCGKQFAYVNFGLRLDQHATINTHGLCLAW